MKSVFRIIAVLITLAMLLPLVACDSDDDLGGVYLPFEDASGSDVSGTDVSGEGEEFVQDSSTLPEDLICAWEVIDIYQEAVVSEISAQAALDKERQSGLLFGYNSFARSGEYIEEAVFSINFNASYDEMYKYFGIQTESLQAEHGADAEVISIAVSTSDGIPCTTVYIINRSVLVAFGEGMNVFTYRIVESVG